jgi:hypothetical protein
MRPMKIPMIPTTHENCSTPAICRLPRAVLAICLIIPLSASVVFAQSSSAPPATVPAASSSQPASPKKPDPDKKPSAASPATSRKVITNDDPEFKHSVLPHSAGEIAPNSGHNFLLSCDLDCERQAKELLQYGPEQEADWQMQVVSARSALAKDDAWREMLWHVIQQSELYCNFLNQQSHVILPTGTDFNSRVERARQQQSSRDMENGLRQSLGAALGLARGHIQELNDLFPVRAAMMQVQLSHLENLSCDELQQEQ